jgi:hypothetical protein
MKVGDLVADTKCKTQVLPFIWLGIILKFDIDGDPVIKWFLDGEPLPTTQAEFRKDVYVL